MAITPPVLRSTRDFGLVGDLTTGWLFRRLVFTAPDDAIGHVVVSPAGAAALLTAVRLLRRLTSVALVTADPGAVGIDLEECIARLGDLERRVLNSVLTRQPSARDPNSTTTRSTCAPRSK